MPCVIDSHHHFWDPARFDYPWMTGPDLAAIRRRFGPADLAPLLAANGVDRTIVVQCCSALAETEMLLEQAGRTAFIAGVVGWVDLTDPLVDAVLRRLRAGPGGGRLVGIRHQVHDEDDARWLLRADVRRGLRAVFDAGLAFDLLVRARELPAAVATVTALPHGRFVLDHVAKPSLRAGIGDDWRTGLAALARHPNVWCKLSGLVTEADWQSWTVERIRPAVRHAWDAFGGNRLMFGSDWPVCLLAADYRSVMDLARSCLAELPVPATGRVWGANAQQAYLLDGGDPRC